MSIANTYGPLIDAGDICGFTYEVRGTTHPIVYVYREVNGVLHENQTQKGELDSVTLATILIDEMSKAVREAA